MTDSEGKRSIFDIIAMFGTIQSWIAHWPTLSATLTSGGIIAMLDVSIIKIPSEYLVALVISALVIGTLVGYFQTLYYHEKAADNKVKNGEIAKKSDLRYDKRYVGGSVVASVLGMMSGGTLTPVFIQNHIIGGGVAAYVIVCILLTAISVIITLYLVHSGLRLSVVRSKDYEYKLKDDLLDKLKPEQRAIIQRLIDDWDRGKI